MSTLGSKVRFARKGKGWTQRELEERAGLTPRHVNRIENGFITDIRVETANKLATALGISVTELLSGEPPEAA